MKKALQISIAQTLFTIEEDAYAKLEAYFQSIKNHFAKTEEKDEIIKDIESRVSEQFLDTQKSIITIAEVEAVIASMGRVEDFDTDDTHETATPVTTKKFYRNPDDKIIAGVCSGLGSYTDIDPLWIRIAFVIFAITTSGFGIVAYIILALVVPEAKNSAQKLEMQGSPVTLETMSESITEKVSPPSANHASTIKEILSWPFLLLKALVDFTVKYLIPLAIVTSGIIVAVISLVIILCLSVLAPIVLLNADKHFDFPITEIVSAPLLYTSVIGLYLACIIPLAVIFVSSIGFILKRQLFTLSLGFTLLFIWCVAVVTGGVATADAVQRLEIFTQTNALYDTARTEMAVSENITSLTASHGVQVTYVQGEASSLVATGRAKMMENFAVEERDGHLYIDVREINYFCLFCEEDLIDVIVTLPTLTSVEGRMGARFTTESWISESPVSLELNNGSRGEITVIAPEIDAKIELGSHLTLEATTPQASINALHGSRVTLDNNLTNVELVAEIGSRIDAQEAEIDTVEARATNGSRIDLPDIQSLNAVATLGSHIEYLGTPIVTMQNDLGSSIEPIAPLTPTSPNELSP